MADPNPADPRAVGRAHSVDSVPTEVRQYISIVRRSLRDYPELNRLTEGVEHSDRDIATAMLLALSEYNRTPPPLGNVRLAGFPHVELLVSGTIAYLFEGLAALETRNQAQFSDGVTTVRLSGNAQLLAQLAAQRKAKFSADLRASKISRNLAEAVEAIGSTGLGSDYETIAVSWLEEL